MAEATFPVLAGRDLVRRYRTGQRRDQAVVALAGVSLELAPGEALGVVGRSGSGKSTLVRVLLGLEAPDAGTVSWSGRALAAVRGRELRELRRDVQAVFQDPATSLDPLQTVGTIVDEPLAIHERGTRRSRQSRVGALLSSVGLRSDAEFTRRLPHELSGGERQRVAIARAVATRPRAVVLDEPVSSLDAAIQGQILVLLARLQRDLGLAMLLVAHDFAVVRALCDRVLVLDAGAVVEEGPTEKVFASPLAGATRELVAASGEPRETA